MLGNYRVATQLVASQLVFSSIELVSIALKTETIFSPETLVPIGTLGSTAAADGTGSVCSARTQTQQKQLCRSVDTLVSLARVISSTLKMEVTRSSETSVYIKPSTAPHPRKRQS
jgi:hypothetical protein